MAFDIVSAFLPPFMNAFGGLFNGTVNLYRTAITPSASDTWSTYSNDLANFGGYNSQAPTWGTTEQDGNRAHRISAVASFAHNGTGSANTIYGFVFRNLSTDRLFAYRFDTPVTMAAYGDTLAIQLECDLFQEGDESSSEFLVNNGTKLFCCDGMFPNTGAARAINLYREDRTPTDNDVLADYTAIAANFPGSGVRTFSFNTHGNAVITGDSATKQSDLFTWTRSSTGDPQTIYGAYIYWSSAPQALIAARRFASPVVMENQGDQLSFRVRANTRSIN